MEKNNSPLSAIPISTIFVLLSMLGAYFVYEPPLKGIRPSQSETKEHHVIGREDVDARLWQDPFAAVAKRGKGDHKIDFLCGQITNACRDSHEREVVILGVMTPGSPYDETAELRLRWRYAAVSALAELGYAPQDSEHIGYFEHNFEGAYCGFCKKNIPAPPLFDAPATLSSNCAEDGLIKIPYEWYSRSEKPSELLLLWLDDEAFHSNPIQKLANLVTLLKCCDEKNDCKKILFKILGPAGSDDLQVMKDDVLKWEPDSVRVLKNIEMYSPFATADDLFILGNDTQTISPDIKVLLGGTETVSNYFYKANDKALPFVHTIGSDGKLCESIIEELKLRDIDIKNPSNYVALVSEWDSIYGRYLPQTFTDTLYKKIKEIESTAASPPYPNWIRRFSYLRGIDGQLPNQNSTDTGATEKQEKTQKTGKDIKDEMYRPTGRNQFDYLLGLARQITRLNETLIQGGKGEIKAIGVLGSDVYDKLLVLQALRPQFPGAVFFTTDLDASMLQPSEYAWTRNLIVVSNFGLVLNESIQKTVPPFRNSYQTSLFFTILLALSNNALFPEGEAPRQDLINRFLIPRIFEVGRRGAVELRPQKQKGYDGQITINGTMVKSIHPPLKEPYFIKNKMSFLLIMPLQLLFLLGAIYIASDWIRKNTKAYCGIGITTVILFTSLPFAISAKNWDLCLEPFSFLEGVSIWPTEIIGIFVFLLSVYFCSIAYNSLRENHGELEKRFNLQKSAGVIQKQETSCCIISIRKFMLPYFWRRKNSENTLVCLWSEYHEWELLRYRILRIVLYFLAFFAFVYLFPLPVRSMFIPARGIANFVIIKWVLLLAFLCMLALVLFVGDAVLLCTRFVLHIAECDIDDYKKFPDKITLIAKRTEAVGRLIFYPFITFSLMAVSRIAYFDKWNIPPGLMAIYTILGVCIFSNAFLLQSASKKAKDRMLAMLHDRYMDANQPAKKERLKQIIDTIGSIQEGAFKPLLQQPLFQAILIPFSAGGMELLNYFVKW